MSQPRRFAYWKTAFKEGFSWLSAVLAVVALVVAVPPVAAWGLSPWVFFVIVLAALLVMLAEGAYRLHRKTEEKRQEALERVSELQEETTRCAPPRSHRSTSAATWRSGTLVTASDSKD